MIFVARVRSFFKSALGKRVLSAVLIATMMGAMYVLPQRVFAQGVPSQPASAPNAAPAPASTGGAPSSGVTVNGFEQVYQNTSSVTSCGASGSVGACVVQIVGFMITFLFSVITYFLSKLVILLTSILIVFARYNKFNNAPPVEIGWVVIRDIVNMFFIVILLASAFMTIIGQAESKGLHYTKVLPSVITGAILVNFSRTLMLLAIDASQVVTLTFISAFEGSIAGNIFQALGITRMTQLQSAQVGTEGEAVISVVNIAIAYLLAMFLLMTAVAMILIYVGYFIFRIVGLWMLIILSPIAFVAGSMPKTFGSMFKSLQEQFDKRFTALLTGGPMIAFFLWLSFATIQRQSATDGLSGADMGFDVPADSALGFITQIGTTGDLAGFIVAVILLGVGFSVATSTAGSVSPLLATAAKKITGYRDSAFKFGATLPWRGTKAIGRTAGRGVGAAASYTNQRLGLTNRIAQGIARGSSGLPTEGFRQGIGGAIGRGLSVIPGVGGALAGTAAAGMAAVGVKKMAEDRKKMDERIKALDALPPEERVAAIRALDGGPADNGNYSLLTNPGAALAQHEALVKNRDADLKTRQKAETDRIQSVMLADEQAKARAAGATTVPTELTKEQKSEAERQAKAVATQKLQDDEAKRVARLRQFAEGANDTEALDRIKKEDKKNMRFESPAKYDERVQELAQNPDQLKELDADQLKSGKLAFALMKAEKVTSDAANTVDGSRLEAMKERFKDSKEMVATIEAVAKQIEGGGTSKAAIEESVRQKDGYSVDRLYATSGNGAAMYSANEKTAIANLQSAGADSRTHGQPLTAPLQTAIQEAIKNKLPIEQIMAMVNKNDPTTGVSDGVVMDALEEMAVDLGASTTKTGEEKLKEMAGYLKMADTAKASSVQLADMINQVIRTDTDIEKLFQNYSKFNKKQQADAHKLISYMVNVESNPKVADRLKYIREVRFPATKGNVRFVNPTTGMSENQDRSRPSAINVILSS